MTGGDVKSAFMKIIFIYIVNTLLLPGYVLYNVSELV